MRKLCAIPTISEKLYWEFGKKTKDQDGFILSQQAWIDYLNSIGVEHIRRFSNYAQPIDYLLEVVNSGPFDRLVIRDPMNDNNFIIIEKNFAEKVLVLGLP